MKAYIKILLCAIMLTFLFTGSAAAITFVYSDDYANWPGYPQPPFTVNPDDQIGTYPTLEGATITVDDNFFLQSIDIEISHLRGTEKLFINTMWNGSSPYDNWDYFATLQGNLYPVPAFTPADYILVSGSPHFRVGHPYSIVDSALGVPSSVTVTFVPNYTAASHLVYTFASGTIKLYDDNNQKFVVGISEDCGNDVFLTPQVPEPSTLILLGTGLLGIAGLLRRRRK